MCLLQHRVEHRREIAGPRIDDLQHLGGRGLLLQRLARLGQQPRILHRDDRLRREILYKSNLFVGKRPHLLAVYPDCTEQLPFLSQRHHERSTDFAEVDQALIPGYTAVCVILPSVGLMDQPLALNESSKRVSRMRWLKRESLSPEIRKALLAPERARMKNCAIVYENMTVHGLA